MELRDRVLQKLRSLGASPYMSDGLPIIIPLIESYATDIPFTNEDAAFMDSLLSDPNDVNIQVIKSRYDLISDTLKNKDTGESVLSTAVACDNVELVKYLLNKGNALNITHIVHDR